MGQLLLLLVVALTVAAVVFGVAVLITGGDPGLAPAEPDGAAVPLPGSRPLREGDVAEVRFDTVVRGYRMAQVDQAMRRAAYDIGYKDELISVLEAEVTALREGRTADADALRDARVAAASVGRAGADTTEPDTTEPDTTPLSTTPLGTTGPETVAAETTASGAAGATLEPGTSGAGAPAPAHSVPAAGPLAEAGALADRRMDADADEAGPDEAADARAGTARSERA